ncbi:MAG: hypothetical protein HY617_01990 [Candidatus Sungbacteria bacterium]|nr:hypothetical protein [Candidatus Sungbacteria bacterium]
MDATLLIGEYVIWHYGKGVRDFFAVWGNLLWFGYHFFSIRLLARTLFAPYKRFHQQYDWKNLDLGTLGQDMLLNLFMRFLGTVLRLCVIIAGIAYEVTMAIAGACIFVIWLLLPVIIPLLGILGAVLLLS